MLRLSRLFPPALLFALIAIPAAAMEQRISSTILSPGTSSCGEWTQARALAVHTGTNSVPITDAGMTLVNMYGWLTRYITAVKQFALHSFGPRAGEAIVHNITAGTDMAGIRSWMDNYCANSPLETISDGAFELVQELTSRWLAANPR